MVGEVVGARGASLGGPYGAAKAHCCVAVDESRSSLAACCVSFYQIVCLSVQLADHAAEGNLNSLSGFPVFQVDKKTENVATHEYAAGGFCA